MRRLLLMGMLCPLLAAAQEVKPIVSADYLALIGNDSVIARKNKTIDSTNNINQSKLRFFGRYNGNSIIKKIHVGAYNEITLHPQNTEYLYFSGSATAAIEIKSRNNIPVVQHEYVQGRSMSGALTWRGAETDELFSYGPSITSLEYDGTNYPYDINGKLAVAGNGIAARGYNNSIFRTASMLSHAVALQANYKKDYYHTLSTAFKAGQSRENTFIAGNKNKADNFSASLNALLNKLSISGSYNFRQERFTHNNRNGFLNRVYQQSLLTPFSFDNSQGNKLGIAQQRSYSAAGDNSLFLLANNDHSFLQQQRSGNIVLEHNIKGSNGAGSIKVSQSFEKLEQRSNEGYEAGTAFFKNGMAVNRNTRDANYYLQARAEYRIYKIMDNNRMDALLTANYLYANNRSGITYLTANKHYNYQRSSNDFSLAFNPLYNGYKFFAGINLVNKIYSSNTSTADNFFLPAVSFSAKIDDIFNLESVAARFSGGFTRFNSELPIDKSFAANSLLQYSAVNSLQYLPVKEVNSFDNLRAIEHREYTARVELSYNYKVSLVMDLYSRYNYNDVFPVLNGGELQLTNIADHRNRGIELELNLYPRLWNTNGLSFTNTISWVKYRSKVLQVNAGYNYTAIAGFSDVHKAIVKDEPLGVIIGNSFLKDASGATIIGADGFPLVNSVPSVIGNPIPDFTMKMAHRLNIKKWDFNLDWEWRKGGDIWNGTAAMLDYYGRSASSALLRNTANYIFNGVQSNGSHNNIPVNFYDPTKPFEQNRWVRYGPAGIAEEYIQKGDCLRLNNVAVTYKPFIKRIRQQQLSFTLSANNILLWSAYKGVDATQLLNDVAGTTGLDFFNLPSYKSFGFLVSLQF